MPNTVGKVLRAIWYRFNKKGKQRILVVTMVRCLFLLFIATYSLSTICAEHPSSPEAFPPPLRECGQPCDACPCSFCFDSWRYEPVYGDATALSLQDVEDIAMTGNKALHSLRQIAAQGQYRVFQARSAWWPQVQIDPSATWTETNATDFTGLYTHVLSFSQTLFNRDLHHSVVLSEIEQEALCTDFAILKNEIRFLVRTAYYNVILQEGQTQVQRENVSLLREALELEERKLAVGESTRFDVNQAKVAFANALSDFFRSRRNLKFANNDLLRLIGRDPGQPIYLVESSMPVDEVPLLKERIDLLTRQQTTLGETALGDPKAHASWESAGAPFSEEEVMRWEEVAMSCQPEIHQRVLNLRAAKEQQARRYAEYLPSVGAFGSSTLSSASPSRTTQVGLSLNWTLFDGWGREARIQEQKLTVCAAEIALEKIIQDIRLGLRDRFDEIEEAVLSYYAAKQSVQVAEQAIDLARARRELGVITPIEYREVAASLTEARQTLNSASFALLRSYYALRRQAGADLRDSCET